MIDICRFCLLHSSEKMYTMSEKCEILHKISSCMSVSILITAELPNKVCCTCLDKIEDIFNFRQKLTKTEKTLNKYLDKGKEYLHHFYTSIKDIKEIEKYKVEDKENTLNNPTHDFKYENFKVEDTFKEEHNGTNEFDDSDQISEDELTLAELKDVKHNITTGINKNVASNYSNGTLEKQYKCLTCFEFYASQDQLLNHYQNYHYKKKVDDNVDQSYVIGDSNGIQNYKCKKCNKTYNKKSAVIRHQLVHDDKRPYICKVCGRTYKTASEIVRHSRAHSKTRYICKYHCGYSTVYLGGLKEHEKRHTSEFKYTCEICGKGFQIKTWYDQHQNIHTGVKPYVCKLCGAAFHMARYLTSHRSTVHPQSSQVKRYECVHCSLPCDSKKALTLHMEAHGIKSTYLCDLCGKDMLSKEQLQRHRRNHLGEKPYTCSICSKSFGKKFNMQLHERSHSGVKSHCCVRCGKRYSQRSTLVKHILRKHKSTSPAEETMETGVNTFKQEI